MAGKVIERERSSTRPKSVATGPRPTFVDWNWFAGGMLRGCGLCREKHWIYAWDDASGIYVLDVHGTLVAEPVRAPKPLIGLAAADTGEWFVAFCKSGHIFWLDSRLQPKMEMHVPVDPVGFAVDPYGDYAVVGGAIGLNFICTRAGRKLAEFETTRPMRHFQFVPNTGLIVGVSEDGMLTLHDHRGVNQWVLSSRCNVGSLAVDGDGATILLAGYGHGIIRFNGAGEREGVYRYDDSPQLVAVDMGGAKFVAASLEKTLTEISYDGEVRASRNLNEKPISLALDPLARYAALAFANGELRFINVPEFFAGVGDGVRGPSAKRGVQSETADAATAKPVKTPVWETRAAQTTEEVDSAVMEVVPGTRSIAIYTNSRKLRIFDGSGELAHESESIVGTGRSLFVRDGWLAAASDSTLIAYDAVRNESHRWNEPLTELSHVQLLPKFGEALFIEASEYVQRVRFPETVVWKKRLEYRAESMVVDDAGWTAMTLEDKNLVVFDAEGKPAGKYRARKPEPMQVVALTEGWLTVARDERVARGHDRDGSILWATPLPWAPWKVARLGPHVLIASEDGRAAAIDETGAIVEQTEEGRDNACFFLWQDRVPARLFQVGETLIANAFSGKLLWRHTDEHRMGGYRANAKGVWVLLGRLLTFFEFE